MIVYNVTIDIPIFYRIRSSEDDGIHWPTIAFLFPNLIDFIWLKFVLSAIWLSQVQL